jgi:hypothetical protein
MLDSLIGKMMPTKQQAGQGKEQDRDSQQRNATVGENVLSALGQPSNLHAVQVRRLWGDHYRVNVFVGSDAASAKVAHSFFLLVDGDGRIVESTPTLTKQY